VLAVAQRMTVRSFATAVFPYPTRAEALRRAAIAFYVPKLGLRWVQRLIVLLRNLG
jgi:hypothetical protein